MTNLFLFWEKKIFHSKIVQVDKKTNKQSTTTKKPERIGLVRNPSLEGVGFLKMVLYSEGCWVFFFFIPHCLQGK